MAKEEREGERKRRKNRERKGRKEGRWKGGREKSSFYFALIVYQS